MLHVLARDGFEDQPTIRPVNKKEALNVIQLGAPVTVVARSHLPRARTFHEKQRTFVVLMPDCGAPEDEYFVKAQFHDGETRDNHSFTARVTLQGDGVTCTLIKADAIIPPLQPYLSCLRALDTGLDAFEALVMDVDRSDDMRADWVSDQDRLVLNALLDHKESVLDQIETELTQLCQKVLEEQTDVVEAHAERTALWTDVALGTLLVDVRTNGDHLSARLARKVAPIGVGEHHRYVLFQPDHLEAVRNSLEKLTKTLAEDLAVEDEGAMWALLETEARKNAERHPALCAPYVTGLHEYIGIADPSLPMDFSWSYRHATFLVPSKDWKADGAQRPKVRGCVWQIGGEYGNRGIPALQLPGEETTRSLRFLSVSKRRGPWALGLVDDRQFGRHLVASERMMACLPGDAVVPPPDTVDRPELPQGLTYLDLPRLDSGIRFDPEYLGYRLRADLLHINPYHPNAEATDQYSWRHRGLDYVVEDDVLVMDAPNDLPEIWRARDFGKDGLDYIMVSDKLMQQLSARGLLAHVPCARIGIVAPA